MNLWGFTPSLFDQLERLFRQFLAGEARSRRPSLSSRRRGDARPRETGAGEGAHNHRRRMGRGDVTPRTSRLSCSGCGR